MDLRTRWKQTTVANQLMVFLTAVIAFATVSNVGIAFFQWRVMNGSDQETKKLVEASTRQAEAVERGIDASKDDLAATRRLTELTNAAELSIDAQYQTSDIGVQRVSFSNSGASPALSVQATVSFGIRKPATGAIVRRADRAISFDRFPPRTVKTQEVEFAAPLEEQVKTRNIFITTIHMTYDNGFGHSRSVDKCSFTWVRDVRTPTGIVPVSDRADCGAMQTDDSLRPALRAEEAAAKKARH